MNITRENFDTYVWRYFDGDLTSEEQNTVISLTQQNDEYKQIFDEIAELDSLLSSEPSTKLSSEFTDSVLKRADQPAEASKRYSVFVGLIILVNLVLLFMYSQTATIQSISISSMHFELDYIQQIFSSSLFGYLTLGAVVITCLLVIERVLQRYQLVPQSNS